MIQTDDPNRRSATILAKDGDPKNDVFFDWTSLSKDAASDCEDRESPSEEDEEPVYDVVAEIVWMSHQWTPGHHQSTPEPCQKGTPGQKSDKAFLVSRLGRQVLARAVFDGQEPSIEVTKANDR